MKEKSFGAVFERLMNEKVTDELKESFSGYIQKTGKRVSACDAMAMVQLKKALDGDGKAFELIRDTLKQKKSEENERETDKVVRVSLNDE